MITKYTSLLDSSNMRQEMEFVFFKHLLLCMDLTKREFHVVYRYENPHEYYLKYLSECGHKIIKEEPLHLETNVDKLNDLNFSLHSGESHIIVFDGLAVYSWEKGLGIIENKHFEPGRPLPSKETMKAILEDTLGTDVLEDFLEGYGEHDPYSPCLISRIFDGHAADIALQMEEMDYRIFDEVYRGPGESDNDEQRIEGLQIYYDHVRGYFSIIEDMKRYEQEMQEYCDELEPLIPRHRDLTDKLGLNLQLFDTDGNRLTEK